MHASSTDELPLLILGDGGFARELVGWMAHARHPERPQALVHHATPAQRDWCGLPVRGLAEVSGPARFLLGVGPPAVKADMVRLALARGWVPAAYVDPTAVIGLGVRLGAGCVVCPYSTVSSDAVLGDYVTLNCRSAVGHDSRVGDFSTLLGSNIVNGWVDVGRSVLMGAGSMVHPRRRIGDDATVGMGAVVVNHVRPGSTVFGNPARRISG